MRVLHLSWEYPPVMYGGLGRHVHALTQVQVQRGDDVVVITQSDGDAPPDEVVDGVRVMRVMPDAPMVPRNTENLMAWTSALNVAMTRAGVELLREWPPEVIHAHDWIVAQSSVLLRDIAEVPMVATIHATEAGRHQGWLSNDLSRAIHSVEHWLVHEASRVIACSEHMRWEIQRLFDPPKGNTYVIPNGVDASEWVVSASRRSRARKAYGAPLVVFAGRLEWEKGVHTLIEAVPRIRRNCRDARIVIAGRGTAADGLQKYAREKRVSKAVTFTGWLSEADLRALVAAADVAVVPSIYEPFGLVALEAAALGTPLAVSRTGGLAELVIDGQTGWTFTAGDAGSLGDAVIDALKSPREARKRAVAARQAVVDNHGWPAIAERTALLYRDAIRVFANSQRGTAAPLRLVSTEGNVLADLPG